MAFYVSRSLQQTKVRQQWSSQINPAALVGVPVAELADFEWPDTGF
jgi:hypothetical protein